MASAASLLLLALSAALPLRAAPADEEVFTAMRAEMTRGMAGLRTEASGPPYFLSYRLTREKTAMLEAAFGSMTREIHDEFGTIYIEARVGDRSLDNTDLSYHGWHGEAPGDARVLRQELWVLTDRAYRSALAGFLEKKARRATEFVPEALDDFSVEASTEHAEASSRIEDLDPFRGEIERLSAVFSDYPFVYDSQVSAQLDWSRRYLLTSEGARLAAPAEYVPGLLRLMAATRALDGMRLDVQKVWGFQTTAGFPQEELIRREARSLAEGLGKLRQAPVQAPAAAPAILDPEFTGVLFHEALGHKLEGQRQRDPRQSQVFKDSVGSRIIPEFLSLVDDPTLSFFQETPLAGHYEFDSEGVAAQRVVLVENGVLKNFLMSRWPIKGFSRSNGHGRADAYRHPSGRMANLIVSASRTVSRSTLKQRLLELTRKAGKPYGFLLTGSRGGENPNTRDSAQTLEVTPKWVYRVDAKTGEETLVRGVKMVGTPLVVLNRIVAAADDAAVGVGFVCGAESGSVPVSQIAPSVLVSEVELQRLPEDRLLPPIMPSPYHEKN